MADEIVYKKVTRKADRLLEGKVIAKHGKQTNQKLKPYGESNFRYYTNGERRKR